MRVQGRVKARARDKEDTVDTAHMDTEAEGQVCRKVDTSTGAVSGDIWDKGEEREQYDLVRPGDLVGLVDLLSVQRFHPEMEPFLDLP